MSSDSEISAITMDFDRRPRDIADAGDNVCTIGRTILARLDAGERVALLQHERVRFVKADFLTNSITVDLIERRGSPRCTIPANALDCP